MKKTIPPIMLACLSLLAMGSLTACDNNNSGISKEALDDFTSMMSNTFGLFSTLSIELAPAPDSQKRGAVGDLFECPNGGVIEYDVTNVGGDSNSITYMLSVMDCNGLTGSLTYDIAGEFTPSNIDMTLRIDGSLNERCSVSFTQFREIIAADLTGETPTFSFTIDGRIAATCREEPIVCTFENDTFDTSNTSFFEQRCR